MYREYGSVEFSAYMTRLYHNLILQGYGVMAEKGRGNFWDAEVRMSKPKQYLSVMIGLLHTLLHTIVPACPKGEQDLGNEHLSINNGEAHAGPSLGKDLLASGGCWGEESQFSLGIHPWEATHAPVDFANSIHAKWALLSSLKIHSV